MAMVEFLGPLSHKSSLDVKISTLSELRDILKKDSEVEKWLGVCSIAVNDEIIFDKEKEINDSDKIIILPPVCGG